MADLERFVDTAATAGGDGTTQDHSGANRAYASLSEAESAEDGLHDLSTDGNTLTFSCAGGSDSTGVTIAGFGTAENNWLRVRGDPSAPDGDGEYGGPANWSTGHYVLTSGGFSTLIPNNNFEIIEGMQIDNTKNHSAASALDLRLTDFFHVFNNRIKYSGGSAGGDAVGTQNNTNPNWDGETAWGPAGSPNSYAMSIVNNIVISDGHGIDPTVENSSVRNGLIGIVGNTIYASGTYAIRINNGSSRTDTITVTNNAAPDAQIDDVVAAMAGSTVTQDYNAHQNGETVVGTSSVAFTATLADDLEDPGSGDANDLHPAGTGSILYEAGDSGTVLSPDIDGTTRKATPDIGAHELEAAGGSTIEASVALAATTDVAPSGTAALAGASDVGGVAGVSMDPQAGLVATVPIDVVTAFTSGAEAQQQGSAAYGAQAGVLSGAQAALEAALSYALQAAFLTTGGQVVEADVELGAGAGVTTAVVRVTEGVLTLAGQAAVAAGVVAELGADLDVAAVASVAAGAEAELETAATLGADAGFAVSRRLVTAAGVAFDLLAELTASGVVAGFTATLSPDRTVRVQADSRVIRVAADDRIIRVAADRRIIRAK